MPETAKGEFGFGASHRTIRMDSGPRELNESEVAGLTERVISQLSPGDQTPALEGKWAGNLVRVAESAVELRGAQISRYDLEGSVIDVDWGWSVVLITAPTGSEAAIAAKTSLSTSTNKRRAADPTAALSIISAGPEAAVASPYTLSASQTHGIVFKTNGTACSVGGNNAGQLGDGTTVNRLIPVTVSGLSGAPCGNNRLESQSRSEKRRNGLELGVQLQWSTRRWTTLDKPTPIRIVSLTGVIAVAAGQYHSLALKADGTVWASGWNGSGRLGDGTLVQKNSPVQVVSLTNVIAIAAGQNHSMALKSDGTVWTWGDNGWGALGDGTTTNRTSPVQVAGLSGVTRIAAGALHSMALKSNGTVWTWGYNGNGGLGDGSTTYRPSIVTVSGLTNVAAIGAGDYHSLAVKTDGTVWAWGRNVNGQLGDASTTQHNTPVQVSGLTSGTAVSGGNNHSTALKSDGTLWAWGDNAAVNGQRNYDR